MSGRQDSKKMGQYKIKRSILNIVYMNNIIYIEIMISCLNKVVTVGY